MDMRRGFDHVPTASHSAPHALVAAKTPAAADANSRKKEKQDQDYTPKAELCPKADHLHYLELDVDGLDEPSPDLKTRPLSPLHS